MRLFLLIKAALFWVFGALLAQLFWVDITFDVIYFCLDEIYDAR